jgi:hypothetical protein
LSVVGFRERGRFAGPATSSDPLLEELLTPTEPMPANIGEDFIRVYAAKKSHTIMLLDEFGD